MDLNNIRFVAFDVETAKTQAPRHICQIGVAIVDMDNNITSQCYNIQPPNNEIDSQLTMIHGIYPDDTAKSPTFDVVWDEIKHLFNKRIVAHQASFDCTVLAENLAYYNLPSPNLDNCTCTYIIFNKGVENLCKGYNIPYTNHHNAGFDAECCAKFYINFLNGIDPDRSKMTESSKKKEMFNFADKVLKGDLLVQDLTNANPDNPFYDKKIVITGSFAMDRKEIALKIKDMGADINTAISRKTNIILMGENAGPSKTKKIKQLQDDGVNIQVIKEEELKEILNGYKEK